MQVGLQNHSLAGVGADRLPVQLKKTAVFFFLTPRDYNNEEAKITEIRRKIDCAFSGWG